MKNVRIIRRVTSFLCALLLLLPSTTLVLAQSPATPPSFSFSEAIKEILNNDTSPIIECANELNALFISNPKEFLHALSMEDEGTRGFLISMLLLASNYGTDNDFISCLDQLDCSDKTSAEVETLQQLHNTLDNWNLQQEQLRPIIAEKYAFDTETIREIIDLNLLYESVDTDFFHIISNAYITNPNLFAKSISGLNADAIRFLGKAISYDLHQTDRIAQANAIYASKSISTSTDLDIIQHEINNKDNATLDNLLSTETLLTYNTHQSRMVSDEAYIYSFGLSSTTLPIYSTLVTTISMGFDASITETRNYTVRIYKITGTETLITSKTITVSGGTSTQSTMISIPLNSAGTYTLRAKLYDSNGNLLATLTSNSVTVKPRWKIQIVLPVDRNNTGILTVYDTYGAHQHSCICLGKSASSASTMVTNGNTPTGQSWAQLEGPHEGYGPARVVALIDPFAGELLTSGRRGILIHGGSRWDPNLDTTNGCVRVTNTDQVTIQDIIEDFDSSYYYRGLVIIEEN